MRFSMIIGRVGNYLSTSALCAVDAWHEWGWNPIVRVILRYGWGEIVIKWVNRGFGSAVIMGVIAPAPKDMPCLIHLFIRSKYSSYKGMKFKKRIKLLLKFWRS